MYTINKIRLGGGFVRYLLWVLPVLCFLLPSFSQAQNEPERINKITSISSGGISGSPVVQIQTEIPVGFRYTVYDSYDPIRVVIDLPATDVSLSKNTIKVGNGPVQEVRASVFDLSSGRLARIELLLTREAKYKVLSEGNLFSISFGDDPDASVNFSSAIEKEEQTIKSTDSSVSATSSMKEPAAKTMKSIQVSDRQILIGLDGSFENFQYFHLRAPSRLVVDLYGIKPAFNERFLKINNGFSQIRLGEFKDKTRLVLDSTSIGLPVYKIKKEENNIIISWENLTNNSGTDKLVEEDKLLLKSDQTTNFLKADKSETPAQEKRVDSPAVAKIPNKSDNSKTDNLHVPETSALTPVVKSFSKSSITVEAVNFSVDNGKSILTISLSGPADISGPTAEKDLVRFGIKKATISRALRRTIDASSFPSAVKRVIPYIAEGGSEVRFLSELKGKVPYSLRQEGAKIFFVVENNGFSEPTLPIEKMVVPVPSNPANIVKTVNNDIVPTAASLIPATTLVTTEASSKHVEETNSALENNMGSPVENLFTGEKISLVFDDANIRNILQLIGEVSNLNIIAGEDVKGTITLRLIDVPWDQALSLILESKGLGMLREGNVVRILPKEQLRAMRQAEMTAVKEEKQLEQVVTNVIPINYTALGNITTPAKELLTDRGKITEDARNKQIIVTDIPSSIEGIKKLAAILDTPERQVMIEARIVEASSSFGRDLGVKWGLSYKNNNGGPGDINNANIGLGGSFLIAPPAAGSVLGNAGMGSGITFGRIGIDSTVLDLRISALESAGYGKVISTPRVSTLNGGTASISQGTKIPYQSSGDDGKAKTEFVDANLSLTVQPIINPDDSIILDISATNSSIGSTVSTGAGTAPAIDTKEAKTKVIVRNGETTVIGGIFVETENSSEAGVPLLMKIPIIGHLFRSDSKTNTRSELLVFITPRIVQ